MYKKKRFMPKHICDIYQRIIKGRFPAMQNNFPFPKSIRQAQESKQPFIKFFFFFNGSTARGGPWPPLQYASKPLDPLLCLSIHLFPSFSGPWTRHTAISFLVFLLVLLRTAFRTTSFLGLRCLAFFLYDQTIVFFGIY